LVGIEAEVRKMDQELSTKLGDLQAENNKQILDKLMDYLKELNADKKYDYIFNASNILIGDEADNLTSDVLKALNDRYAEETKK
jgi:outer membrane protein